jgi:crotonobetainyl-CoA:carnitine CoA-transferase CaiB-like acyl-CoA transferase
VTTTRLWTALGGDPHRAADVEVRARARYLPSAFDVDGIAVGAVSCALLAAAELAEAHGRPRPALELDAAHVACAFASERHLRRAGAPVGSPFAALSRFAPTRDGWIRLHANYDHHRRALLAALAVGEDDALAAVAERGAEELETAIVAAGGAAAAVRTPQAWAAHPQGRAVAGTALVERRSVSAGAVRPSEPPATGRPAQGVRVLDLTRVIAGPVATRFLAALGADVLRLDPPHLPEIEAGILDTCPGKRLAAIDLRRTAGQETLHRLLADADVLVQGYRPGALTAFGLGEGQLAERHPHLVVASLAAWGLDGPWAQRRGFDSLVQSACGIATTEGSHGEPGALPVQALDHATGYLIAAGALRGLAARRRGEDAAHLRYALAATAAELMTHPATGEAATTDCDRFRITLDGNLSLIAPPGSLDGRPLGWARSARASEPTWGPTDRGDRGSA